ncbi:MAG: branched-chain amino acid ABC transporter permease [Burkholderiaceae bacterium]|jgi:branched-chain amino acid transport system permease protein|nr:branched-chain amino acid ABC transporter permease [Burkholderiaceae bacterium]
MRFDYNTRYRDSFKLLAHPADKLAYGALIAVLLILPAVASSFVLGELAYVFILCIASLGLMLLTGYTGQVSLGHAAFVAIGAYAHAWLMSKGMPLLLSVPLAGLIAGFAGLLLGIPAIRVSGLYLAMVTMAFAIIVEQLIGHWESVTGGFTGMAVAEARIGGWSLGNATAFYYLCLAVLCAVFLGLLNLLRSAIGRSFMGVRDSEAAACSLGIHVRAVKVAAFAISAGITGIAGALIAHHLQYLTPDGFTLLLSLELVLMVVIGGAGSLRGAILGAVLISMLPTAISRIKPLLPEKMSTQFGLEIFVFGLILALFVLFEPGGMNGRWLKLRAFLQSFPLYRRDTFKRQKRYMKSERYR